MSRNDDDYDSPWKTILETYFEAFMRFFFPDAADDIDWSRQYQFLDKELQQVTRDADLGRRYADKLVQVWRRSGAEAWVLAHVEIQGEPEPDFAKRMFVYNYRIFDRYDRPVASMAVLADDRDSWRPDHYGYALWGSEMVNRFAMVKLIDFQDRLDALEGSDNPFAVVTVAHLTARRTRHDDQARFSGKLQLIKSLYRRGWDREQILALFHFIDWLLRLPEGLEDRLWDKIQKYEQEDKMPFISSVERIGMKKGEQIGFHKGEQIGFHKGEQIGFHKGEQIGFQKGAEKGEHTGKAKGYVTAIEVGLSLKFGDSALSLMPAVKRIDDPDRLLMIVEAIKVAKGLDEVRQLVIGPDGRA